MSNQGRRAPDLLREAADLITRALLQLDVRETGCGHCGARKFRNYDEAKVAERFTKTPTALRESAARLDNVTRSADRQGDKQ